MSKEDELVLTKEGKKKLEDELHYLENEKRAEIGERIKVAREFGDLSENSEYDDAKNEQAMVENRITEIHNIITNSKVVRKPSKNAEKINIGSKVKVKMNNTEREFTIVGGAESDVANGKISNLSPVGVVLIGSKKGDKITTEGPTGKKIKIEILSFSN